MSLKGIAQQTLDIVERGSFDTDSGGRVEFASAIDRAVQGTQLYTPERLALLLARLSPDIARAALTVQNESTQAAAHRLARQHDDVALLNFASAKNAGGGFLSGAKAQEEDLTRCSALYPCLTGQSEYYSANRASKSMLYTDHIIYSPRVPFFRIRSRDLLDHVYCASVITAPAPNAGEHLRRGNDGTGILETLRRRAGYVLAIAKEQRQRHLVLGAWGCGVFRNDPHDVADAFARWLNDAQFADAFESVHFAVLDRSKAQRNLHAFEQRFSV